VRNLIKRFVGGISRFLIRGIAGLNFRFPWLPIGIFLCVCIWFGIQLPYIQFETKIDQMASSAGDPIREAEQAAREFSVWEPLNLVLLGNMALLPTIEKASEIATAIRAIPNVARVVTPFDATYMGLEGVAVVNNPVMVSFPTNEEELSAFRDRLRLSPEGNRMFSAENDAILFQLYVRGGISARGKQTIEQLIQALDQSWGAGQYHLVGETYLGYMVDQTAIRDVATLFPFSLIIVVLVLWLSFRKIWGVLLPSLTVMASVVCTLGLMAWNGDSITIISAILPILLVTLGTADAIHIYSFYLEESRRTTDRKTTVRNTMKHMSIPVLMTSLTTALGFGSLITSSVIPVREFGYYSVFGILCAMVFSLTALPALLCLLPHPALRSSKQKIYDGMAEKGLLRFAQWIHHRKSVVIAASALLIAICIWGITRVEFESNLSRYFRRNTPVVQGIEAYEDRFGGSSLLMVVIDTGVSGGSMNPDMIHILQKMETYIDSYPLMTHTQSFATLVQRMVPHTLTPFAMNLLHQNIGTSGIPGYLSADNARKAAIQTYMRNAQTAEVSRTLAQLEIGLQQFLPEGMKLTFAGTPRIIQMHMESFAASQQQSLTLSGITVFFVVSFLFLSLFLGALAMIPLVFTVCINFGVMGLSNIPLDAATMLIASISIGVGIDYSIHILKRVLSELKRGLSIRESCVHATKTTGHAILINSVTLISGFGILVFSRFLTISAFGGLMAMTMGISALAALTIIPAFLGWPKLMPKRVRRWLIATQSPSQDPELNDA